MISFIEMLRALATILITNSHYKGVYPSDALSFGGGLGLALFFMISGYLQSNIKDETRFVNWFIKKAVRLYVPLYVVRGIQVLFGVVKITSIEKAFMIFLFPGTWFGASFLILHSVYYFCVKYFMKNKRDFMYMWMLVSVLYIVLFVVKPSIATFSLQTLEVEMVFSIETPYLITQCIWMFCMFLGLWIKRYREGLRKNTIFCGIISFVCVGVFASIKIMTMNVEFMCLEFFLAPVYIFFGYFTFMCFMSMETWFANFSKSKTGKFLVIISQCSLEIYYIQSMWIEKFRQQFFPVNWILITVSIVLSAYCVHILSVELTRRLYRKR